MSIVKALAETTLESIAVGLNMREQGSAEHPYRVLRSPMTPNPVGSARLFHGSKGEELIYIGLTVPMIQLDSHMVFCFTAPDSAVPHFTVDAVHAGDHYAFHLDLIPRVDLGVNLSYLRTAYEPLTPIYKEASALAGLTPAHLSPMQLAVMSPWMLAHRATAEAMDQVGLICSKYLQHWQGLHGANAAGLGELKGQAPAARDGVHRSILFSREVDPVWGQVERLLGHDASEELRLMLVGKGLSDKAELATNKSC